MFNTLYAEKKQTYTEKKTSIHINKIHHRFGRSHLPKQSYTKLGTNYNIFHFARGQFAYNYNYTGVGTRNHFCDSLLMTHGGWRHKLLFPRLYDVLKWMNLSVFLNVSDNSDYLLNK